MRRSPLTVLLGGLASLEQTDPFSCPRSDPITSATAAAEIAYHPPRSISILSIKFDLFSRRDIGSKPGLRGAASVTTLFLCAFADSCC